MKVQIFFILLAYAIKAVASEPIDEATQLYNRGEFQKTVNLLSKKIALAPKDAGLRLLQGKTYLKLQSWDQAIREFETAIQLAPANGQLHLWLGRACGAKASHVSFFTAFSWARRVVREFETARRLAPDNLDIRFDLLEYYLNAPGIVGGGKDKAEAEVQAITRLNAGMGFVARAQVYQKEKQWNRAQAEFESAIKSFPAVAAHYEDLADYCLERDDYGNALAYARRALALKADLPRSRLVLAAASIRMGKDIPEAQNILKQLSTGPLTDEDPPFEEVYYWIGMGYLAQGERAKARAAFDESLRFNPYWQKSKDAIPQTGERI